MKKRRIKARAKYRKLYSRISKKKPALPGPFLIRFFVFIIVFALTGLIYVKQRNENVLFGYEVQKIKKEFQKLSTENQHLQSQLEYIKTSKNLRKLIQEHNLTLQPPTKEQIVRLNRPQPLSYSTSSSDRAKVLQPGSGKESNTRLAKR